MSDHSAPSHRTKKKARKDGKHGPPSRRKAPKGGEKKPSNLSLAGWRKKIKDALKPIKGGPPATNANTKKLLKKSREGEAR